MSDKKTRTIQEIHEEYSRAAFKAGNLQYQIVELNKDLGILNSQLRDLNFEAAAVSEAEKSKPASEGSAA